MNSSSDMSNSDATVQGAVAAGEVRLPPGHRVGRYTVRRIVGVGGMGCVYEAADPELSRVVALKVLRRAGGTAEHDSGRLRLLREGQAMARLSHPNVVPVYGVDSVEGMVYIAMEYVQGVTLRQWLRAESRTWSAILDVMLQAGAGLSAAHAQGIIHRDFKPGNLLVGDDGRARVMDFGLARGQDSPTGALTPLGTPTSSIDFLASQPITKAGAVVGTPAYMAPEQHFGRTADATSDQFAFCVTFYEALFGRRPFHETGGFRALARAKDRGEVIRPPRGTGVPRWLVAAVLRGLSARKVDRFPTMEAMLALLGRGRRRRPSTVVVGLSAGILAVTGVVAAVAVRDDRCGHGRSSFDAVWGQAQRDQVHAAFEASGRPHAVATFDRVVPRLDAWGEQWRDAFARACRADPSPHAEETLACLGRHRAALAAAVRTLSEPHDRLLDAAVQIATSLPPASDCASPLAHRGVAPPAAELAEAVQAVWSTLAAAQMLEVGGRFGEGVPLAQGAVVQAEGLDYAPLLAEALRIHGNLLERDGKRELAALTLERAYGTAVATGDDSSAALAAARLVTLYADALFSPELAQRWLDALRARVGRLGVAPMATVWLRQAEGTVAMGRSDYVGAADAFAQGLVAFDAVPDRDPVRRGALLHNLGVAQFKAGRLQAARAMLAEAIQTEEATLGGEHPSVAASLMALAGVHYAEGNSEAAMLAAQRGLQLQRDTLGPRHPEVASSLGNLAGLLIAMGRRDEATKALREAMRIWDGLQESAELSAFAIGNLGTLMLSAGALQDAEPVARRALRMKTDLFGEAHEETATARVLLGDVLLARRNDDGARQEFEQARRIYAQVLGPEHPSIVPVLMRLGASQDPRDHQAAQNWYSQAATLAEHNARWSEAGDAHFAAAQSLGASRARAAKRHAKAALAAYERAPGDQAASRHKVQAWLADLG